MMGKGKWHSSKCKCMLYRVQLLHGGLKKSVQATTHTFNPSKINENYL